MPPALTPDTPPLTPISSREEASGTLQKLVAKRVELNAKVAARDRAAVAFQKEQAKRNETIAALEADILEAEALVKAWAWDQRKTEFGASKSLKFTAATLQYKDSPRAIVCRYEFDDKKVLGLMLTEEKENKDKSTWSKFIRRKPEIDRQGLLKATALGGSLDEKRLAEIGLKIVQEEKLSIDYHPDQLKPDVPIP